VRAIAHADLLHRHAHGRGISAIAVQHGELRRKLTGGAGTAQE
jgi:hypothetical protein